MIYSMTTLPFNQSLSVFEENLPDIRTACIDNATHIINQHSPYAQLDVDQPITEESIVKHIEYLYIEQHAKPLLNTVRRIDSYRKFKNNHHQEGSITELDVQNARNADEGWFIHEANLSTRRPHKGVCPFHDDKDPSLTLMKSKARGTLYLKCFACGWHGDSIGYIMKRDNVDFMDAVKRIVS